MKVTYFFYSIACIIAVAVMLIILIAMQQRSLLYFPDTTHYHPSDGGLIKVQEVSLMTEDGAKLVAWYQPAASGQPTFLYFHGNGGGLLARAGRFKQFERAGIGLFMMSYRGFSGSSGRPSEQAMFADARLAYDHLRSRGLAPNDIGLYGESLGTGVAVHLATEREIAALVLEAPYTSMVEMGRLRYPFLPVGALLVDRFESINKIGRVRAPILIMHGTNDTTIPVTMGQEMFAAAPEPKVFEAIHGAGHSNIFLFDALERLQRFLRAHIGRHAKPETESTLPSAL